MQAPTIGGVRVRKGDGETIRLARGSSLTDFAEKIGVDAASLVQMLFSLGEMVTATESVNDATLELLPIPNELTGSTAATEERALFLDFLLGLWAFSTEIVRAVELIAAPTLAPSGAVVDGSTPPPGPEGELLR